MSVLNAALLKRNEKATSQARESLGQLQKTWEALEDEFRKLGILKSTGVKLRSIFDDGDYHGVHDPIGEKTIGVAKVKGQWRVCLGSYYYQHDNDIDWTPIVDCSTADRIAGLEKVKDLMAEVVVSNEKAAKELDAAVLDAAKLLKEIGITLAPDEDNEDPF